VLLKQLAILWIAAVPLSFTVTDRCFWTGFVIYFLLNNTGFAFCIEVTSILKCYIVLSHSCDSSNFLTRPVSIRLFFRVSSQNFCVQCISFLLGVNVYTYIVYIMYIYIMYMYINPLNAELNPICYLLALLGAHHFLHVSRIRVKDTMNERDLRMGECNNQRQWNMKVGRRRPTF